MVGDHERRVKAHAELTDDIRVPGLLGVKLLTEAERAAVRDHAQILLQLLAAHTDAVIADGEGALLGVGRDGDGEVAAAETDALVRQAAVAELVDGVGRVGQKLTQEDLLVGIDGVNHQLQQAF